MNWLDLVGQFRRLVQRQCSFWLYAFNLACGCFESAHAEPAGYPSALWYSHAMRVASRRLTFWELFA